MGHTKPADLLDLSKEIDAIRSLTGLREKSPNVFYFKSIPFLHFHDKDGVRWADVKSVSGQWRRLEINFEASANQRRQFTTEVRTAYDLLTKSK